MRLLTFSLPVLVQLSLLYDPPAEAANEVGCVDFELTIEFDLYPEDVSWSLVDLNSGGTTLSGGPYSVSSGPRVEIQECIPDSRYRFTIRDTFNGGGDGLCSDNDWHRNKDDCGFYEVIYNGAIVAAGADYGAGESTTFGQPPSPGPAVTYYPGKLSVSKLGLRLSKGLDVRKIAQGGSKVQYTDGSGGRSSENFHYYPDGAAVIPHPTDGGWYYVSNSESWNNGGVGAIRFNSAGEVIGYRKLLTGTRWNCSGGRTYWNTWVSCEEQDNGRVWEVDPVSGNTQLTRVVKRRNKYESFAFDDQDPDVPARFYVTCDSSDGPLTRYTPTQQAFDAGNSNKFNILNSPGGKHEYLVMNGSENSGTFSWSTSRRKGASSALNYFPYAEGLDIKDRKLFMTVKYQQKLFILDLATSTYEASSTRSGAFNLEPDQLKRILNDDSDMLYFCEDNGDKRTRSSCDIHGRSSSGQFFTIVKGTNYDTETTGLAFSPDAKHMYVSFQGDSIIFDFWRKDGLPFNGQVVDIKYH